MIGLAAIVGGYGLLIWQFGWLGLAAAGLHIGVMLLASWRL